MSVGAAMPLEDLSSVDLLVRAQEGDQLAVNVLFARYAPRLRRWASGRLPPWARDLADTSDLVQDTLLQVSKRIDALGVHGEGELQAYLRQALLNRVRNELRRASRKPHPAELNDEVADDGASPLEQAIGTQMADRYEAALQRLGPDDRALIIAKVELGYGLEEVATLFEKPSRDAARMACARALVRLAREMSVDG
jgi:RNA polymerase sigma-70 factor (ECF subfamily)